MLHGKPGIVANNLLIFLGAYKMGDISKHFNRAEMACKCGCGLDTMDAETLDVADDIRDWYGKPIKPNSAARCLEYNRHIGSRDTSQHVKCRALDLPVDDPQALFDYLCEKYRNKYGMGLYKTFVHFDTRTGGARRWIKT